MYLKPFLKYLLHHKARLAVALVAMFLVAWLHVAMLGLVIPALKCMFPQDPQTDSGEGQVAQVDDSTPLSFMDETIDSVKEYLANTGPGKKLIELKDVLWGWFQTKYIDGGVQAKMQGLLFIVGILIVTGLFKGIFEYFASWALAHTFYKIALHIREDVFRHIINLDYIFFSQHTVGYLESRVQNDVRGIRDILRDLARGAIQEPFKLFGVLCFLLFLNAKLTIIVVLVTPFSLIILFYFARILRKVMRKQRRRMDALNSVMEEAFRNFKVIQTYHTADYETARFVRENDKIFKYFMKGRLARFASSPIVEFLGTIALGAVIMLGGYMIIGDKMEPEIFITYLMSLTQMYGPVRRIAKLNIAWQSGRVSAERITEMLSQKPHVVEDPQAKPIKRFEQEIEFNNVSFAYGEKTVLENLSFSVAKGKIVAIVGKTGAGKTTLVNLLPRLIDPTSGTLSVDGADIRQYQLADLRHLFGIVTQEIILFNDTVAHNIAYGEKEFDQERIEQAAKAANAHDFIMNLEGGKGYDALIGMDGNRLSGGQRQRLAIARAIYRDPQILIFDEATSNLDEDTQRQVQEAIDHLLENRTAFVIAHRLSTIKHADEIFVLSNGRIIERGSHEELLQKKTYYSKLYNLTDDLE